jgi:hypothetical protein
MYDDSDIRITTPPALVRQITTRAWYAGDQPIVKEQADGRFALNEWYNLDRSALTQLHAALGQILTDIAAERMTTHATS